MLESLFNKVAGLKSFLYRTPPVAASRFSNISHQICLVIIYDLIRYLILFHSCSYFFNMSLLWSGGSSVKLYFYCFLQRTNTINFWVAKAFYRHVSNAVNKYIFYDRFFLNYIFTQKQKIKRKKIEQCPTKYILDLYMGT